jgi:hydroxymethylglutaryl-CoA lyase/(R)-citramalyl-CoA lyase
MTAVTIVDVGPRDGLQNAAVSLAPALRAELSRRIYSAGVPRVEAASFVNPARVPQMAGAEDVLAALPEPQSVHWCSLVLNERGLERALDCGARSIRFAVAVSDDFNRRNANRSTADGLIAAEQVLTRALRAGCDTGAVLATSFGCPFAGHIDPGFVADCALRVAAASPREIIVADTIGVAAPAQIRALLCRLSDLSCEVGVHLHNTRNTGYANAYEALSCGATVIDASIGGLGGCPFAPNATGNVATEDLVYLLERSGFETGVDLERLIHVAGWLQETSGLQLPGYVHRAPPFPPAG